eukprot:5308835-Amphidinium_carterae.1
MDRAAFTTVATTADLVAIPLSAVQNYGVPMKSLPNLASSNSTCFSAIWNGQMGSRPSVHVQLQE